MKVAAVLVVGAGPTGLLAAAELRRRDIDCLLIDAHEQPNDWDRATVVHPRTLEIFEQLGIIEPLLAAGVKQHRAHIQSAGEALGEIDLGLCGSRYPFNIGISEEVTERILTDYLISQGGSVIRGARLVSLAKQADGMVATIEHDGVATEVLAHWVIGCDGHNSKVREIAGIEQEGHDIADPWAVFDAELPGWERSFEANYAYLDDVPVILTALPDRRWRVYMRPSSPQSDLVSEALSTLQRYLPHAKFEGVANPTRFQCHTKVARHYRAGRFLLAGDAAHTCSPAQGHGMNSGLHDAFNLAWKLSLVCQGHASETLLDSYQAERRPVAEMITQSGDAADAGQMIRGPEERRKRDIAIRGVFADPGSRHHEAVAEAELDVDYAGSPIVMGDDNELLWPGQRLPDNIEVRLPGGSATTLHRLASRSGHTAFLIGGASTEADKLTRVSNQLTADGAIVEAIIILTVNPGAVESYVGLDAGTAIRMGIDGITLLVIRTDGHIALRADAAHAPALARYLTLLNS